MSANTKKTSRRRGTLAALLLAGAISLLNATPAFGADQWQLDSVSQSHATPGSVVKYLVVVKNVGDAKAPAEVAGNAENCTPGAPPPALAANCYALSAQFPPGLKPVQVGAGLPNCTIGANSVTCQGSGHTVAEQFNVRGASGEDRTLSIFVEVDPLADGALTAAFEITGAGAGTDAVVDPLEVSPATPPFGLAAFDLHAADPSGDRLAQAGAHPDLLTSGLEFNSILHPTSDVIAAGGPWPVDSLKDAVVDLPPGLVGAPTVLEQCTTAELGDDKAGDLTPAPLCPSASQVGVVSFRTPNGGTNIKTVPLFNMVPPAGEPARFGFNVFGNLVFLDAELRSESDYGISVLARNTPQALAVSMSEIAFWGVPSAAKYLRDRACPGQESPFGTGGSFCESGARPLPFFRNPTSCTPAGVGLPTTIHISSWQNPGAYDQDGRPDLSDPDWDSRTIASHEPPIFPAAPGEWGAERGNEDCGNVPVKGELSLQPTSIDTETSSGLAVHVEVPNPGFENPTGVASSDLKRVKVSLPQGVTINPSQAEGLGVCSSAQYESSELSFYPSDASGCPADSKIGTVQVRTQLLEETLPGDVYVAKPFDNPFDSLLAIYIVLEEPQRGVLVKLPGEIRTNERSGRIEAEFDDLPQLPFSSFDFKFREGARAPLVTPPTCGSYETVTEIEGWSDPGNHITSKSSFEITRGIGGGPCPSGAPGFNPGFSAGTLNNNAGSYSPFVMRLTRKDGEQDMTRFSAVLPPGVLGKLAGVEKCPQSAIALAKSKSGIQEKASPSCPANSEIGRSLVGAGVGSVLTHIPGKVYLGGAVNGRPLSVIAITPAVAGPFDVGTVVVQEALTLNPKTAEVEVDGSASDPIPHMLKGIPAKLRDLRVYVDRPQFTLNPTSCDPSATKATLFGGGGDAFTSADDFPVFLSDRFQAASCLRLGFKPRLGLKLKGGTRRGGHPGLRATYRPRPGHANVESLVVRLPRSAFLDQGHIRTICTRVQFAADACPKGAQYGYIKAWTPLLDTPLEGPVWLRSSDHKLPDLVFDLHGLVDVEVATRIDSIRGGVRASVDAIPDAPLSKVVLRMQGGKKGLIVNSRNLCAARNRANVRSDGHNGKVSDFNPVMRPQCRKKKRKR